MDAKGTPGSSDAGEEPPFHGGKSPTNVYKFDASPAIVGDQLFLKGKTHLYCIAK
jgi:hypothetical protein